MATCPRQPAQINETDGQWELVKLFLAIIIFISFLNITLT